MDSSLKTIVNKAIDVTIETQIIINTLKLYIDPEAIPGLYAQLNNGPNNLNRNILQFLQESGIKGVSKTFIGNFVRLIFLGFFESKLSPDSHINLRELSMFLTPLKIVN